MLIAKVSSTLKRNNPQPISHGRSAKNPANLVITTPITDSNNVAKNRSSNTRCTDAAFIKKPRDAPLRSEKRE
jgi:hypothetical protein